MSNNYQRILCPISWSNNSMNALKKTANYTRNHNIQLDILYVIDSTILAFGNFQPEMSSQQKKQLKETYEKKMANLVQEILAEGSSMYQVHSHIRFGDPRKIICENFLEEYRDDLIVLGQPQFNHLHRALTGSVYAYVNKYATCDILTVR
ncbi:universal stress protein [Liquorilactobacillus mali]|nr:universal stress protein [Liquorilactobacillus mali]MDN7144305.1 universal stress protein [Liquorilactobacillus mali]